MARRDERMQLRDVMHKRKKLLCVGEEVEVRQLDEGLRGSWQIGRVIGVPERARVVRYGHLLDEDGITKCIDRIVVSDAIEGSCTSLSPPSASASVACGYRGRIRPSVPSDAGPSVKDFWYGLCVDAWYEDGWWEGVVFDHGVGSGERSVFFPDEGDELRLNVDRLRLTRDWDEASGAWMVRGTWAFLSLIDELTDDTVASTPFWIKQLWYRLRMTDGFVCRISDWTLGQPSLWKKLMKRVVNHHRLADSNEDNGAVAVVSSDEEYLPKRRRVGEPKKKSRPAEKVQRKHRGDGRDAGNVDKRLVVVEVGESTPAGSGSPMSASDPKHVQVKNSSIVCCESPTPIEGKILATLPLVSVVENSEEQKSSLPLASVENSVPKYCHHDVSSNLLHDDSEMEQRFVGRACEGNADGVSSGKGKRARRASFWRPVCENKLPSPAYNLNAIVDYAKMRKKFPNGKRGKELVLKARMHLRAVGWQFQYKVVNDKTEVCRYVSPEGKIYFSLVGICKDMIPSIGNELNGTSDHKAASYIELKAPRIPQSTNERRQQDIAVGFVPGDPASREVFVDEMPDESCSVKESTPEAQFCSTDSVGSLDENGGECLTDRPLCAEEDDRLLSSRDEACETSTGQLPPEPDMKDEVLDQECACQAIADYVRLLDEKRKFKAPVTKKLLDRVRLKAKGHLLAMGWKFKHELKSGRWELHYFTPEGKRFVSFYVACSAYLQWEEKQSLDKGEDDNHTCKKGERSSSQLSQILGMTLFSNPDHGLVYYPGQRCEAHKVATEVCGPPAAIESASHKNIVSCSSIEKEKTNNSDDAKDQDQKIQVCEIPDEPSSAGFKDNEHEHPVHHGEKNGPTISKSSENRMQVNSDASFGISYISTIDRKQGCLPSWSVPADEPVTQRLVVAGFHEEKLPNYRKSTRGKHPKVLKVQTRLSFKIKSSERVFFLPQSMPVDKVVENESIIAGPCRGRPPGHRKRKRGRPAKVYKTRSCVTKRNLVSPSTNHTVRTILSWLIDNDVILPRQKVFYRSKRGDSVMAEGRITRKGILCSCCRKVYSITNFEAHAGSAKHRPAAHIFLKDGRSLLQCQTELLCAKQGSSSRPEPCKRRKVRNHRYQSDSICTMCHYGGLLILCDQCPSSFHLSCVNLKEPPKGKWFCPCCRCSICGQSDFSDGNGEFAELAVLYCDQCEREYHMGCWGRRERQRLESFPKGNWFCSRRCSKIFLHLHKILGKPNPTSVKGLCWTIVRSINDLYRYDSSVLETMTQFQSKISVALDVLHECFVPIVEHRTKSDLVADVLFNRSSDLNRLNFRGFYTMLLERGDELISVATIRIHGEKVAEMPFIGTRVQYRRQGMCRLLVSELENMLSALGVERLILPAASQLKATWIRSFGFTELTSEQKFEFLGFTFLDFQDTTMCQKLLKNALAKKNPEGEIKDGGMFHLSSETIPKQYLGSTNVDWHAQSVDRALHSAGANSAEAAENSFLKKTLNESSMQIAAANIVDDSSSVEVPQDKASVDLGCGHGAIYSNHEMDANANVMRNLAEGLGGDFFHHIYTRRCRRITDESVNRIKQIAFCN